MTVVISGCANLREKLARRQIFRTKRWKYAHASQFVGIFWPPQGAGRSHEFRTEVATNAVCRRSFVRYECNGFFLFLSGRRVVQMSKHLAAPSCAAVLSRLMQVPYMRSQTGVCFVYGERLLLLLLTPRLERSRFW